MTRAQCSCGGLTVTLSQQARLVVACHCFDCQRRTGSPFGVGVFYPSDSVAVSGSQREFNRSAASGGKIRNYFCPNCGSTVFWRADNLPGFTGVAIGALADPRSPAPALSIFEQSKHHWLHIDGAVEHFQQSSATKNSK
ncbi:GFA family protein [Rhizobium anhuiense]|uniref:GFA family protein n=1 Tax=Rhizobium anhuiense TaxID=1184720 RepID=UPI0020CE21F6|nr:GFA family protein [Rhizobium anhuiense]UTS91805.1 GFA family protein [Rhizobium anhuiense bv. trifolii]